jgi:hypothetical protein
MNDRSSRPGQPLSRSALKELGAARERHAVLAYIDEQSRTMSIGTEARQALAEVADRIRTKAHIR